MRRPTLRGVECAFVVGLALELAGAILLAAEFLTADPRKIRLRGATTYGGPAPPEQHRNAARSIAGLLLLALGFAVQIVGYAIDGGARMILLAGAVVVVALIIGRLMADRGIASWLQRRAQKGEELGR